MKRYNDNLQARQIKLSKEDKRMLKGITERRLGELEVYGYLSKEIKSILVTNVLIVATTESIKRIDNKADTIIGNIPDAIKLVMKDVHENSAKILED